MLCGIGLLVVLVSNIWTISGWSESRGVYDDVCYLRQAHLFQQFGLDGLNTDIKRDDDRYLVNKLKAINFPDWNTVGRAPCHTWIAKTGKHVIQYPPGTGFALALFPEGFQVIPLYVLASIVVAWAARSDPSACGSRGGAAACPAPPQPAAMTASTSAIHRMPPGMPTPPASDSSAG